MKNSIIWVILICIFGCESKEDRRVNKIVEYTTWIDTTNVIVKVESLTLLFSIGFEVEEEVEVLLNNKLIGSISCKTDNSTGYCLDNESKLVSLDINLNSLNFGDTLFFSLEGDMSALVIPSNIMEYNRLVIGKGKSNLNASLERTGEILHLE